MASNAFEIMRGPDKFTLMTALFHGDSIQTQRISVEFGMFHVSSGDDWEMTVIVNGVEREDGSGRNWLVTGEVLKGCGGDCHIVPGTKLKRFFYSSANRRGSLEIDGKNIRM